MGVAILRSNVLGAGSWEALFGAAGADVGCIGVERKALGKWLSSFLGFTTNGGIAIGK